MPNMSFSHRKMPLFVFRPFRVFIFFLLSLTLPLSLFLSLLIFRISIQSLRKMKPIWGSFGAQKMDPKWAQNGPQMGPKEGPESFPGENPSWNLPEPSRNFVGSKFFTFWSPPRPPKRSLEELQEQKKVAKEGSWSVLAALKTRFQPK